MKHRYLALYNFLKSNRPLAFTANNIAQVMFKDHGVLGETTRKIINDLSKTDVLNIVSDNPCDETKTYYGVKREKNITLKHKILLQRLLDDIDTP